jgi:hypothetical protein
MQRVCKPAYAPSPAFIKAWGVFSLVLYFGYITAALTEHWPDRAAAAAAAAAGAFVCG